MITTSLALGDRKFKIYSGNYRSAINQLPSATVLLKIAFADFALLQVGTKAQLSVSSDDQNICFNCYIAAFSTGRIYQEGLEVKLELASQLQLATHNFGLQVYPSGTAQQLLQQILANYAQTELVYAGEFKPYDFSYYLQCAHHSDWQICLSLLKKLDASFLVLEQEASIKLVVFSAVPSEEILADQTISLGGYQSIFPALSDLSLDYCADSQLSSLRLKANYLLGALGQQLLLDNIKLQLPGSSWYVAEQRLALELHNNIEATYTLWPVGIQPQLQVEPLIAPEYLQAQVVALDGQVLAANGTYSLELDGQQQYLTAVPMLSPYLGKGAQNYGWHFPLSVGSRVVLSFIDADPQQPLIIGRLRTASDENILAAADPNSLALRTEQGFALSLNANNASLNCYGPSSGINFATNSGIDLTAKQQIKFSADAITIDSQRLISKATAQITVNADSVVAAIDKITADYKQLTCESNVLNLKARTIAAANDNQFIAIEQADINSGQSYGSGKNLQLDFAQISIVASDAISISAAGAEIKLTSNGVVNISALVVDFGTTNIAIGGKVLL